MLKQFGARKELIKQGNPGKLNTGRIQITTHYSLITRHDNKAGCDLVIIDEAHRAKSDGSDFNRALCNLSRFAKRKLSSQPRRSASN